MSAINKTVLRAEFETLKSQFSQSHHNLYYHLLQFANPDTLKATVYYDAVYRKLGIDEDNIFAYLVDFIQAGLITQGKCQCDYVRIKFTLPDRKAVSK